MGSTVAYVKCYLSCIVLFVTALHIYNTCPVSTPYTDSSSLVCKYSHKGYYYIQPYANQAFDYTDVKLIQPAHSFYESSPVKPYVELASQKTNALYASYGKKHVDFITLVMKSKANEGYEKLLSLSARCSIAFCNKYCELYKIGRTMYLDLFAVSKNYFSNRIYPQSLIFAEFARSQSIDIFQKLRFKFYLNYNLYLRPRFTQLYFTLKLNTLEPSVAIVQKSAVYGFVEECLCFFISSFKLVFIRLSEFINALSEDKFNWKSTEEYLAIERKKEFVKGQFNKIFNADFKIPNYEDYEFFKKLAKKDDIAPAGTTAVELTTPTVEKSEYPKTSSTSYVGTASAPTSKKYQALLREVGESSLADFNKEVSQIEQSFHDKIFEKLKPKLQELSKHVNSGYEDIQQLLGNINTERDIYAANYVSRQDMRDSLNKVANRLNSEAEAITEEFKSFEKEYSEKILGVRTSILETLEEFSESSLSEYSREIIARGDHWSEWRRFKEIKLDLLEIRNSILNSKPDSSKVELLLGELNKTLAVLLNDGQSYLAILRAKANLEFQSREKKSEQENDAKRNETQQEIRGAEEEPETSTVVIYETVVLGEDNEPASTIYGEVPLSEVGAAEESGGETVDATVPVTQNVVEPVTEQVIELIVEGQDEVDDSQTLTI